MLTRKGSFVVAALVGLAGVSRAQTARILGREEAAFARALFASGYSDLADGVCTVVKALDTEGKADFYEVLNIRALSFDLRLERAQRERDMPKRRDAIVAILGDMNAFIEEQSRTQTAEDVRNSLPEVYLLLGEALVSQLAKEQDPTAAAQLRDQGKGYFEQAIATLRTRIEKLEKQIDDETGNAERLELQLMLARYNLARTQYYQPLLLVDGDPLRKKLFVDARDAFGEFGLDYSATQLNYNGLIYQGLCSKELGQFSDAFESFDEAIAIRETFEPTADGRFDVDSSAGDIVSMAVLAKVNVLAAQKNYAQAESVAQDFFDKIPDGLATAQGLAVLAAQADARSNAGDSAGSMELAQKLVDADPAGPWGARGRDILGKAMHGGGGVGPELMLGVAETMANRGEYARALDVCQSALRISKGTAAQADIGATALFLTGQVFWNQDRMYEASFAFDTAAETYASGKRAGDALWQAVRAYQVLAARERRPFYEKRARDRMRALATRYPSHPHAYDAQLNEGDLLEGASQWPEAIALYRKITAGTPGYEESQFRIGRCFYAQARAAAAAGKPDDATPLYKQAEEQLRSAESELVASIEKTLDAQIRQQFNGFLFQVYHQYVQLLLETKRTGEVQALTAKVEDRFAQDPARIAAFWPFRIQALQADGKLDEAVSLFEEILRKQKDAPGVANAAGILARGLDQAGADELTRDPVSKLGDDYWTKAAHYYVLSIQPQLDDPSKLRVPELESVALRLYAYGLHFNHVPDLAGTFVDWSEKPAKPEMWDKAAEIYAKLLELAPKYEFEVSLARTLGFLQRWTDAERRYASLFDTQNLVTPPDNKFNAAVVKAKGQLVWAYLEWAVCEHRLALEDKQTDRFTRAQTLIERVLANTQIGEKLWWQAKYHELRAMMDRGEYDKADVKLRDVKRSTSATFDENKYGYQARFEALEKELATKVFRKKGAEAPPVKK